MSARRLSMVMRTTLRFAGSLAGPPGFAAALSAGAADPEGAPAAEELGAGSLATLTVGTLADGGAPRSQPAATGRARRTSRVRRRIGGVLANDRTKIDFSARH